ncbi:major facilitator superfamily transporter [Colletotrichum graminicola]|uniref:Major facilitator superfamily transporter n=1 Tax=Colletotrichum graminicola (strain M1.001 / M2 / FGSC 10212) TaxID=645133 RepID=E3QTV8_COLGM|nr:major facilitator superfamily transporter [Colletotrichum graminicola M1.001]EFQ34270.1 major facilitator superfamily transporter [Colletotrichum graminicola M1.001]WDK12625.1 major facilitator superfamily transporter [Colletotrichum graminicola]
MTRPSDGLKADEYVLSAYPVHEDDLPGADDPDLFCGSFRSPRRFSARGRVGVLFRLVGGGLRAGFRGLDGLLTPFRATSPRAVILVLALLKFTVSYKLAIQMMPIMRLIEDHICHQHYRLGPEARIPEMKCKVDEVQRDLAWLQGWQSLFGAVVNMTVAFPYGVLSDRIGRKAGMLLAYTGTLGAVIWPLLFLARFPEASIYLILVGILFFLVGGGVVVFFNNLYAMAADVSTAKDRASNFVFLSVGAVTGGLLGPVTAGFMMERHGPWAPIRVMFLVVPVILLLMMLLPETLRGRSAGSPPRERLSLGAAVGEALDNGLHEVRESVGILRDRNVMLCLAPSLVQGPLGASHGQTLPQYISKYFGWTLAQTTFLMSPLELGHLAVLLALPWLSRAITDPRGRFRRTGCGKDALLARVSYFMIASGALIGGLSRDVVVFAAGLVVTTLGSASFPVSRALITGFVDPEHTSRLYALASMADTLGSPLGGPVLAWAFSVGMEKKGGWKGLPWFYVFFLATGTWAALMLVKVPKENDPTHLESDDGIEIVGYKPVAGDEPRDATPVRERSV